MSLLAEGPLSNCLEIAGDMLAATGKWQELCSPDADGGRSRIYVAEVPRRIGSDVHTPSDLTGAMPFAIVHFDDEGVASTFTLQAAANMFVASHTIIVRLYLSPPVGIDPDDRNLVELWTENTVGRIIRGADADASPGLLDLSHRGGMLTVRQLDVLGPAYPSVDQRATDQALYVAVELILQIGLNG